MKTAEKIKWLYDQIPHLIENEVINEDAADRLKAYFGEVDDQPSYQIGFIIAAFLGAILVGGGIILIFAYNWEFLSIGWRTVFSLLPLIIAQCFYGYAFFKKKESQAWVEGTSAFLMLMLASSIALISQTYHLSGSMESFILSWMLLSIPLMYLLDSSVVTAFYLAGISAWAVNVSGVTAPFYWVLLLAAIPHLYKRWKVNPHGNRIVWLSWIAIISFSIAFFGVMDDRSVLYFFLLPAFLLGLFYLAGLRLYDQSASWFRRPLQTFAVICIFIWVFVLCYEWPAIDKYFSLGLIRENGLVWVKILDAIIAAITFIGFGGLAYTQIQKKEKINWVILLFPIMIGLGVLLIHQDLEGLAVVLANLFLLGVGIRYILNGIQNRQMAYVNLGMFFIATQIIIRFFATDLDVLLKGIIFVILGLCFLGANYVFSKRLKKENLQE